MFFFGLTAILLAATPGARFDRERPPPRMRPWTALPLPIEIADGSEGVIEIRRLDGHVASFGVAIAMDGAKFEGSLAAAHCVDILWPGHTHVVSGRGNTVRDGYDWQVSARADRITLSGQIVTPFASDALAYVRRLLAGETPPPAASPATTGPRDPRSDPNVLRLVRWALDHPAPDILGRWTRERCKKVVERVSVTGQIRVAISSATEAPFEAFASLAVTGHQRGGAARPSWRGPSVTVVTWSGLDMEGFAVVGQGPTTQPLAHLVQTALKRSAMGGGEIYQLLRNELAVTYSPQVDTDRGRVYVVAEATSEGQIRAALQVAERLRDRGRVRGDAEAAITAIRGDRLGRAHITRLLPERIFDPGTSWLLRTPLKTARIPTVSDVADAIVRAFSAPAIVLLEPRIDSRALRDTCRVARVLGVSEVHVVELPNGGTRRHACVWRR